MNDIIYARQASSFIRASSSTVESESPETAADKKATRPPPIIVRLASAELARRIMHVKSSYTRFNTSDLDISSSNQVFAKHLFHTNIYINESLSSSVYSEFRSLKQLEKNLGFKYVWHRGGKFFVRLREGLQAHYVKSASDLSTILRS